MHALFILCIILGSLSLLGASFVTTANLKNGGSYISRQQEYTEIPLVHEMRPFRKFGIPLKAATILTETNDNGKMSVVEEERILEIDEITQTLIGVMRVINEPTNNSYFTKGDVGIIVLSHALHMSGIGIGYIIGKLIIDQRKII